MDKIFLVLLLVAAFVAGLLGRSVVTFVAHQLGFGKKRRQVVHEVAASAQGNSDSNEGFQVLGKMGYYLASNDECDTPAFSASPMQDLDPKDLA